MGFHTSKNPITNRMDKYQHRSYGWAWLNGPESQPPADVFGSSGFVLRGYPDFCLLLASLAFLWIFSKLLQTAHILTSSDIDISCQVTISDDSHMPLPAPNASDSTKSYFKGWLVIWSSTFFQYLHESWVKNYSPHVSWCELNLFTSLLVGARWQSG